MDRIMNIKEYLQQHPQWKKRIHGFIMHPVKTRPYWWIRVWQPFYIKKGRGSVIYSSVRKDLPPFHLFQMGKYSVVEDFSCLNNAVGDIVIGDLFRKTISCNRQLTYLQPELVEENYHNWYIWYVRRR